MSFLKKKMKTISPFGRYSRLFHILFAAKGELCNIIIGFRKNYDRKRI